MAKRGPTIAKMTLELIRERGPQLGEELGPVLAERGITAARDPVAAVRSVVTTNRDFVEGADGRWHSLADQLEGTVFAVRPTTLERREEVVLVRPELDLVEALVPRSGWAHRETGVHRDYLGDVLGLPHWDIGILDEDETGWPAFDPDVSVREELGEETADELLAFQDELGVPRGRDEEATLRHLLRELRYQSVLHGPDGWMPALRSRELLGLCVESGAVRAVALDRRAITGVHVPAAGLRIAECVADLVAEDPDPGYPAVPMEALLRRLVTDSPEIFRRPLPPLPELLVSAGFEVEDGLIWPNEPSVDPNDDQPAGVHGSRPGTDCLVPLA